MWRDRAWRVCRKHRAGRFGGSSKTAPELVFGSFPKTAPVKIPEGRVATSEGLHWVEANFSKSSQPSDGLQCKFSCFAPKGLQCLVFRGRLGGEGKGGREWVRWQQKEASPSLPGKRRTEQTRSQAPSLLFSRSPSLSSLVLPPSSSLR